MLAFEKIVQLDVGFLIHADRQQLKVSTLWQHRTVNDASGLLSVLLRVQFLPRNHESQRGRLLRFLFLRRCPLPVEAALNRM